MTRSLTTVLALTTLAGTALAQDAGVISTDRFGYAGTITRYATLADAMSATNATDVVNVADRDLGMYFAHNDNVESDFNAMLGSWWYTTHASGSAGNGNTHGNTGVGFLQLYDADASTDVSTSMSFGGFDGTYYTEFNFSMSGENTTAADAGRVSVYDNVNDGGLWHTWSINLQATGLQGYHVSPNIIEATGHPTGVTGSITGLFELTENQTSPANQGFYVVDFALNMDNWAFDNQGSLVEQDGLGDPIPGTFYDSYFRTVPAPSALAVLGLGGLAAARRRRA